MGSKSHAMLPAPNHYNQEIGKSVLHASPAYGFAGSGRDRKDGTDAPGPGTYANKNLVGGAHT